MTAQIICLIKYREARAARKSSGLSMITSPSTVGDGVVAILRCRAPSRPGLQRACAAYPRDDD